MKTSTKILLGFFILLFTTPIIIAKSLQYQYLAGNYTTKKNTFFSEQETEQSFPTSGYSVLCLQGDDSLLAAPFHIVMDSTGQGKALINHFYVDTLLQSIVSDTLRLQIKFKDEFKSPNYTYSDPHWMRSREPVVLKMQQFPQLVVRQADVVVKQPSAANAQLNITLFNGSSLQIGILDSAVQSPIHRYKLIQVDANNSNVELANNVVADETKLKLSGTAQLKVQSKAKLGSVSGSIEDGVQVEGHWSMLKQLIRL